MENSKLIQVLKTLDKKEWKAFDKFLSKLYSEHELAVALFRYLKSFYPNFKDDKLDLAYITNKVFKIKDDKTKRISNEASKLFGWLEEFLMLEKLRDEKYQYRGQELLIDIYKERKLSDLYFRKIEHAKTINQEDSRDLWMELRQMELNHAYYYHPFTEKLINTEQALADAYEHAETFFQIIKLKYQCELQSRAQILRHTAVPVCNTEKSEENIIWRQKIQSLYENAYNLITTKQYDYFISLKNNLFEFRYQLNKEDHFILLGYLINHAAHLIRNGQTPGQPNPYQDAFELYKYGIEKELITVGGYITETRFHNIVNVACELEAFAWVDDFIQTYQAFLIEEANWNVSTIGLAQARILFAKKNYKETLDLVKKVKFKDHAFLVHAKLLEIRCYYELGEQYADVMDSAIRSFDTRLYRNNNLSANIIEGHRNFLVMLKMILNGLHTQEDLMLKLQSLKPIVVKSWLLEKIKSYQPVWSSSLPKTYNKL